MHFSFSKNFIVSCHILGPRVSISHFPRFSQFLTIFQLIYCVSFSTFFSFFFSFCRSYSVCFTLFHVFQFSCHIPVLPFSTFYSVFWHILGPRLWISHFPRFSVFIAIFQVLQCVFLIPPPLFSVSCHIPGPTMCFSHFSHLSFFLPHSASYSVCFSFFTFSVFLAIFQVLSWEFLIFLFRFPGLSPYSRSYSMHFSFSTCFSFTCHITCPIMCVFHFLRFSVFFFPYSRSYSVCF